MTYRSDDAPEVSLHDTTLPFSEPRWFFRWAFLIEAKAALLLTVLFVGLFVTSLPSCSIENQLSVAYVKMVEAESEAAAGLENEPRDERTARTQTVTPYAALEKFRKWHQEEFKGVAGRTGTEWLSDVFVYGLDPDASEGTSWLVLGLDEVATPQPEMTDMVLRGYGFDERHPSWKNLKNDLDPVVKKIHAGLTGTFSYSWRRYLSGPIQFASLFFFFLSILMVLERACRLQLESCFVLTCRSPALSWLVRTFPSVRSVEVVNLGRSLAEVREESPKASPVEQFREGVERFMSQALDAVSDRCFRSSRLIHKLAAEVCHGPARKVEVRSALLDSGIDDIQQGFETDTHSIRWLNAALPALGFIGTILGIGEGLGKADGPIGAVDKFGRVSAVQELTATLGVAFDTTLVALVLGLVASLVLTIHLRSRDTFLERLKRELDKLFRLPPDPTPVSMQTTGNRFLPEGELQSLENAATTREDSSSSDNGSEPPAKSSGSRPKSEGRSQDDGE